MVVYGVNAMLLPHTDPTHWDWLMKEEHFPYFSGHWHRMGMIALGTGVFSVASAATGYRRGERWAWFAAWYWPALFLLLAVDSWSGIVFVPFVALALVALLVPFRSFFPKR